MDTDSRLNGNPAVAIGLYLAPGANAIRPQRACMPRWTNSASASRRPEVPRILRQHVFRDRHDRRSRVYALLAFALVVLVVFLFLGNLRATIIPMVAIPVSLIGTFAVLLALGFSANTVSLLALVLAIGIVVDDAIVVVENVERVMAEEPDLPPGEATKKAMGRSPAR